MACPAAGEHAVVPLWVRERRRCVPQRALRDAGSLDEYLKCVGVRGKKRQKLLEQYELYKYELFLLLGAEATRGKGG